MVVVVEVVAVVEVIVGCSCGRPTCSCSSSSSSCSDGNSRRRIRTMTMPRKSGASDVAREEAVVLGEFVVILAEGFAELTRVELTLLAVVTVATEVQ